MKISPAFWPTPVLIVSFIAFQATGSLLLRVAGTKSNLQAFQFFVAANAFGFVGTIFLTFALRDRNPNIIYALCHGGGFCVLQLAAYFLFQIPLTVWQWIGIALVSVGVVCLQIRL